MGEGRSITVASFGKHPGWTDFMDHLGVKSELVVRAKNDLVIGAVGTLIAQQRWDAVPSDKASSPSHWLWMWQEESSFLIGLTWPSQDGITPPRRFPMTLCAHCTGVDVFWAVEHVLPLLLASARELKAAKTKEEVADVLQMLQQKCQGLRPVGTLSTDGYLARAEQCIQARWMATAPDSVARVLYFLRTELANLGIASKEVSRKKQDLFPALRLPCSLDAPAVSLGGILAFLRTQIDNSAPLVLICPAQEAWCDVFFGKLWPGAEIKGSAEDLKRFQEVALNNALRLRQSPAAIPLTTETPYQLDSEFSTQLEATLKSVPLPWGDPAKHTIFGPVPARYRPHLPGEDSGKKDDRKDRLDEITKHLTRAWDRRAELSVHLKRFPKRLWMVAGGVALAGLLILVVVALFHDSSSPNTAPPVTVKKDSPPPAKDDSQGLRSQWLDYVASYNAWFKDVITAGSFLSVYFEAQMDTIRKESQLSSFDPLDIYGQRDSLNLTDPQPAQLKAKEAPLRHAIAARDGVAALITNRFPAKIVTDLQALDSAPLKVAANELRPQSDTSALGKDVRARIDKLTELERREMSLTADWKNWTEARQTLEQRRVPTELLDEEDKSLQELGAAKGAAKLSRLLDNSSQTLAWLQQNSPRINLDALNADQSSAKLHTLSEWTNFASQFINLYPHGGDPRTTMRESLETNEVKIQMQDIRSAADAGQAAAVSDLKDLSARRSALDQELTDLTKTPAIQKNKALFDEKIPSVKKAVDDFLARLREDWENVFNFDDLIKRQRAADFSSAPVNTLWSEYVGRVVAVEKGQPQPPTRQRLIQWREAFEQAHPFFDGLRGLGLPAVKLPSRGGLSNQWAFDYQRQLVNADLDANLHFKRIFGDFAGSQEKSQLDHDATECARVITVLLNRLDEINHGKLPETLTDLRENSAALANYPAFADLRSNSELTPLAEFAADGWQPKPTPAAAASNFADSPPKDFLHLAVVLAELNEASNWPGNVGEWRAAVGLWHAGVPLSQGKGALDAWLNRQWQKLRPSALPFDTIVLCANAAASIPSADLPPKLAYNSQVGILMASFNNDVPAFQQRARDFLTKQPEAPDAHRQILNQICGLSGSGTDWAALRQRTSGVTTNSDADGASFVRDGMTVDFKLLKPPGVAPVFVCVSEFSCENFLSVANSARNLRGTWLSNLQSTLEVAGVTTKEFWNDPVNYLDNLEPVISGTSFSRLELRSTREADGTLSANFPVNFISPNMAQAAAKAWGCRLLNQREWAAIDRSFQTPPKANLASPEFSKLWQTLDPKVKLGAGLSSLFFGNAKPSAPEGGGSSPAHWLESVNAEGFALNGLFHWRGNVSEILFDPSESRFYIAGGSFASAKSDPEALKSDQSNLGYADVGFRLAFDWVGADPVEQVKQLLAQLTPM